MYSIHSRSARIRLMDSNYKHHRSAPFTYTTQDLDRIFDAQIPPRLQNINKYIFCVWQSAFSRCVVARVILKCALCNCGKSHARDADTTYILWVVMGRQETFIVGFAFQKILTHKRHTSSATTNTHNDIHNISIVWLTRRGSHKSCFFSTAIMPRNAGAAVLGHSLQTRQKLEELLDS